MQYRVLLAPAAAVDLRELPRRTREDVQNRIRALAEDPRPVGVKHLSGDLYRIRVGDFRVVYAVSDREITVLIVCVAHRREVYRFLRRKGLI
jgi:mRNA interferase RelE/StbE